MTDAQNTTTHTFTAGNRVCGGEPHTDDYDEGTVLEVAGDQVTVAWSNCTRTTQCAALLRAVGA